MLSKSQKLLIILTFLSLNSCSNHLVIDNGFIQKARLRSESDNYTYLSLSSFASENKNEWLQGVFTINGLVNDNLESYQPFVISVLPGAYDIHAGFIGRKWIKEKFEVNKGDSLVLNFFLQIDTVMHE